MTDTINWPALIRQQTLQMILDGREPDDQLMLHWLPDEDRWEVFNWGHWLRLRARMFCDQVGLHAGLHYFVVCVHDHEGLHNLIPHKYLINPAARSEPTISQVLPKRSVRSLIGSDSSANCQKKNGNAAIGFVRSFIGRSVRRASRSTRCCACCPKNQWCRIRQRRNSSAC
jgi:hypothetical protein